MIKNSFSAVLIVDASLIMSSIDKYDGCHTGRSISFDRASEKNNLARCEGKTIVSFEMSSPYLRYNFSATSSINVCFGIGIKSDFATKLAK